MKTKEVVALMNISQDTLRYYEKVGVIPPVNRDENGYRIYNDSDLNWILDLFSEKFAKCRRQY